MWCLFSRFVGEINSSLLNVEKSATKQRYGKEMAKLSIFCLIFLLAKCRELRKK